MSLLIIRCPKKVQLDILYLYYVWSRKGGTPAGFSNMPLLFHSNTPILITIGINILSQYIIKYKKLQPIVLKNTNFFTGTRKWNKSCAEILIWE